MRRPGELRFTVFIAVLYMDINEHIRGGGCEGKIPLLIFKGKNSCLYIGYPHFNLRLCPVVKTPSELGSDKYR